MKHLKVIDGVLHHCLVEDWQYSNFNEKNLKAHMISHRDANRYIYNKNVFQYDAYRPLQ